MIDALLENKSSFSKKLGIVSQTLNNYLNGSRNITNLFLKKIESAYPNVNIEWLKHGKGEMLINKAPPFIATNNETVNETIATDNYLKKELELKDKIIELKEQRIAQLEKELQAEKLSQGGVDSRIGNAHNIINNSKKKRSTHK